MGVCPLSRLGFRYFSRCSLIVHDYFPNFFPTHRIAYLYAIDAMTLILQILFCFIQGFLSSTLCVIRKEIAGHPAGVFGVPGLYGHLHSTHFTPCFPPKVICFLVQASGFFRSLPLPWEVWPFIISWLPPFALVEMALSVFPWKMAPFFLCLAS